MSQIERRSQRPGAIDADKVEKLHCQFRAVISLLCLATAKNNSGLRRCTMRRDIHLRGQLIGLTPSAYVVDSVLSAVPAICVRNTETVAATRTEGLITVVSEDIEENEEAMGDASPPPSSYAALPNPRIGDAPQNDPYVLIASGTSRWTEISRSEDLWCGLTISCAARLHCFATLCTDSCRTARTSRSRTIWPPSPISSTHLGWPSVMKLSSRRRR